MHYDPMIAKVIACAETRDGAIDRMRAALSDFVILGLPTNIAFLSAVLDSKAFRDGGVHTAYLDEEGAGLSRRRRCRPPRSRPRSRTTPPAVPADGRTARRLPGTPGHRCRGGGATWAIPRQFTVLQGDDATPVAVLEDGRVRVGEPGDVLP